MLSLLSPWSKTLSRSWSHLSWPGLLATAKGIVRYVSTHSGVPALIIAAVLVVVGYRLLKRSARFAIEVTAIALVLAAASELGWLRW